MASRHGQPQYHLPQDDIQPWLDAQDEHERQLRLLSQRHELQGQIAAHNQQIIQYQQQIEQRQQQLLTALAGYALTLPQEDEEELVGDASAEAQSWQHRQNRCRAAKPYSATDADSGNVAAK